MQYNCKIWREENMFLAQFPDMPNVLTGGFSRAEALAFAKEALDGIIASEIDRGFTFPPPSFTDGCPIPVDPKLAAAIRFDTLETNEPQEEDRELQLTN
ncbi:type II toxin-antitoxin system HicB family antitoxin [Breznakiellaceae bacterium SP9]